MSKKSRFSHFCLTPGLAVLILAGGLAGACKALPEDENDTDYLMPLPGGVIVLYETGSGSYVPYESGLAPGDRITRPPDPIWPNADAVFGGWFKDGVTFYESWDFDTDTIPPEAGKNMTLYAQWNATETERWIARNWIWENQGNDIMGQIIELETGEEYTLYIKCWMQGGNSTQNNHVVAFCLDPDTGARVYSVRQQIFQNNLWTEYTYTFTAQNRWYVVGVFPGLAASGGGTFYTRETRLTKTGDDRNMLRRSDFKFGAGLEEDKTYFTQGFLAGALTKDGTGKNAAFSPGTWYFGSSRFGLLREQSFWNDSTISGQIASQGGVVYLDDRE
ncbi:MAG: InlB B-repeat-containing protein [Treponema sp.]|jgi:hypothetical protein|nr:InlB B-repeat-containing protein [Treponema sp.]